MSSQSLNVPTGAEILGLDNVPLELPIAGVGSRTLAGLVDYLLLLALLGVWWTAGLATMGLFALAQGWFWAILVLGSFLIQWGYFAVLEIVMQGQTPGKNVVGLRVVADRGGRASAGALLVRNLIRALDLVFGLPAMAVDRRSRRLGDMAAGTLVVHERPPGAGDEVALRRLPAGWGAREVVVAESFLRRADRMEPRRAQELAGKLLGWIAREESELVAAAGEPEVLAGLSPGEDRVALLRRLLRAEGG
ncbi:MAG TPA: RDD family protein [Thermoanaerobaculia bacterium]|jgi:uncharacterized RDD family membrane protein YckC